MAIISLIMAWVVCPQTDGMCVCLLVRRAASRALALRICISLADILDSCTLHNAQLMYLLLPIRSLHSGEGACIEFRHRSASANIGDCGVNHAGQESTAPQAFDVANDRLKLHCLGCSEKSAPKLSSCNSLANRCVICDVA